MENLKFESWREFKSCFSDSLFGKHCNFKMGNFVFRGQGNSDWKITSSLDRNPIFSKFNCSQKKSIEMNIVERFIENCTFHISSFESAQYRFNEKNGMATCRDTLHKSLSLAQHHGVPTRLVDWSYSPYIAAFFAFASSDSYDADKVSIYALDISNSIWGRPDGVSIVKDFSTKNRNLIHQRGLFTHNESESSSIEEYLGCLVEHNENVKSALYKFILPSHEKSIALTDLSAMCISYASLFPSFDGCAKATVESMLQIFEMGV